MTNNNNIIINTRNYSSLPCFLPTPFLAAPPLSTRTVLSPSKTDTLVPYNAVSTRSSFSRILPIRAASSGAPPPPPSDADDRNNSQDDSSSPLSGLNQDWRAFRAKLIANGLSSVDQKQETETASQNIKDPFQSPQALIDAFKIQQAQKEWCHPIAILEKGAVLLSNPLLFVTQQPYFYKSVIVIMDHTKQGTTGVILNKRLPIKVKEAGGLSLPPQFEQHHLFLGGDVNEAALFAFHSNPTLKNSEEILPGFYATNESTLRTEIPKGNIKANDVKLAIAHAGWGPGQLDSEIKQGVWYPVACSAETILNTTYDVADPFAMYHKMVKLAGGIEKLNEQYAEWSSF